ncbi:MAG: hypothetical protein RBR71_03580 [Gudongella sp.]|nr:hypothetical protein [Gudongella sp.]
MKKKVDNHIIKSEDEVKYGAEVKEITTKEVIKIIKARIPRGVFYANEGRLFIGVDNRAGDAWVEEFDTREDCISWLMYGDDEEEE